MIRHIMSRINNIILAALLSAVSIPAHAEIILSQVIVDLQPGKPDFQDVEIWNTSSERAYVQVDPAEIQHPGQPGEQRRRITDPELGGLLVSPQRLVLEANERRMIRIAAIAPRGEHERTYRVAVRPVAAPDPNEPAGLKVMLGYDMLVLFRPARLIGEVQATRRSDHIEFSNNSNFAQEIYDAQQCDPHGQACVTLAATRLYPGTHWRMPLTYQTPVSLMISTGSHSVRKSL